MKLLQFLFKTLWTVSYWGNGILVLYIEWSYLRLNFTQIFNPFVHWQVAGTLLASPLFWVLLGMSSLGYYGYTSTEKRIKRYEKIKQSRKISIDNSKTNIRPISSDGFKYQQERTPLEEPSANPETKSIPISSVQQNNVKASLIKSTRPKKSYVGTDFYELQRIAYSNWSDAEILHKIYCELETIPSQKAEKLGSTITQWLEQLQKRPHIGADFYELQRIYYSNWNDIDILGEIQYELKFLTGEKGQDLYDKISRQLKQLQKQHPVPPDLIYPPEKASVSITYPDRRYRQYKFDELKEIVNENWSNVSILNEIRNELENRSRKKAQVLYEDIIQRLIQLQNQPFPWPNTTATFGSGNLPSDVFPNQKGILKQYEYKVGIKGLPESQRRHILDLIFLESLSFEGDATYLNDWGNPSTSTRLRKMADSIAAFTRNGKRHKINDLSQAIQDWESDLAYLKRTYYEGHFDFDWPRTDT